MRRFVQANGLRFAVEVHGDGPKLVLLLHGFPDDAGSMAGLAAVLAARGYTAACPCLRGYAPTEVPRDGDVHVVRLAEDAVALTLALGFQQAAIVGHDWGAIMAYAAIALAPERFTSAVCLSVPPPRIMVSNLPKHPSQILRSAYIGWFQVPWLSELSLRALNYLLVSRLWAAWSPGFALPPGRAESVRRTLSAPGTLTAVLRYYRQLIRPSLHPAWRESRALLRRRLGVPTLVITGERDGCIRPGAFEGLERAFSAPVRLVRLPDAGHFVHLEAPDEVAALVVEHLEL